MTPKTIATKVLAGLLLASTQLAAQIPGSLPEPTLWLQGNFSQDTTANCWLNFQPALLLDSNTTAPEIPHEVHQLRQATIFTVYQNNQEGTERPVWEMTGEFGDVSLSTQHVSSEYRNFKMPYSREEGLAAAAKRATPQPVINTYTRSMGHHMAPPVSDKAAVIRFGAASNDNAAPFTGIIAEHLVFEKLLKPKEIAMQETYLALKYGITLEKNYLNTSGTVVWKWDSDSIWSHNIAGIGRDDQSTLYQKQGSSSNQSTQLKPIIGVGAIAATNSENSNEINNQDFLIWGDNGKSPAFEKEHDPKAKELVVLKRNWLMNVSGSTAPNLSTEVSINAHTIRSNAFPLENLCLVIDTSGTGNFSLTSSKIILPTSMDEDGTVRFAQVNWDTDHSGKDRFTFGLVPGAYLQDPNQATPTVKYFAGYPNPTTDGHYNLEVSLSKPGDITIEIFDLNGRQIERRTAEGKTDYRISGTINDASGMYTIVLTTSASETPHKITLVKTTD